MTSTSWNENSSGVVAPKQKCPPSGVGVGGGGGYGYFLELHIAINIAMNVYN